MDETRDPKTDPYSAHEALEALDRAFLQQHSFEEFVATHPYVQAIPELKAAAEQLSEQLASFYQLVGSRAMEVG